MTPLHIANHTFRVSLLDPCQTAYTFSAIFRGRLSGKKKKKTAEETKMSKLVLLPSSRQNFKFDNDSRETAA